MTIPRELSLVKLQNEYLLRNFPVRELDEITHKAIMRTPEDGSVIKLNNETGGQMRIDLAIPKNMESLGIVLSKDAGQFVRFGIDRKKAEISFDRSVSGNIGFSKDFMTKNMIVPAIIYPDGDTMTGLIFPDQDFTVVKFYTVPYSVKITDLRISSVESVWRKEIDTFSVHQR